MMIFSYSKAIAHVVENFLNRNEMIYRFDQDSGVFWFRLNSDSMPLFNTFCCFDVHNKYLLFEAFFPVKVSFISASLIKEELSDINSSLLNGRFQLDSESGMVKFRCYLDCSDRMPSGGAMMDMLQSAILALSVHSVKLIKAAIHSPVDTLEEMLHAPGNPLLSHPTIPDLHDMDWMRQEPESEPELDDMQPDSDDAHVLNQLLEVLVCPDQKPDDSEQ